MKMQSSKWPERDETRIADAIRRSAMTVATLRDASPSVVSGPPKTDEVFDSLYPGNPWLCLGENAKRFNTQKREDWRGQSAKLALFVPSPMLDRYGRTKRGKLSQHTLEATGPRKYLDVEFDDGLGSDAQAGRLAHLAKLAPLVTVTHSGGKSLHGLFACAGSDAPTQFKFMQYAVSLGADSKTWTPSQFVRIPDGTREKTGERQQLLFFNAGATTGSSSPGFRANWVRHNEIPETADFTEPVEPTEQVEQAEPVEQVDAIDVCTLPLVEGFLPSCLPVKPHQNNGLLLSLGRGCLGVEGTLGRKLTGTELAAIFGQWHCRNKFLRDGTGYEEYFSEFMRAYENATLPLGQHAVKLAWEKVKGAEPLPEARQFPTKQVQLLVSLCAELQRSVGSRPFWLSCRDVAAVFGVSQMAAWNWLSLLRRKQFGLLHTVSRGDSKKAARFYYMPVQRPPK